MKDRRVWAARPDRTRASRAGRGEGAKRDFIVTKNVSDGAEVSHPQADPSTPLRTGYFTGVKGKKKSACFVRNDVRWGEAAFVSELKLRPPKAGGAEAARLQRRGRGGEPGRGDTYLLYMGLSGIIPTL
jgi:hypothetical protein